MLMADGEISDAVTSASWVFLTSPTIVCNLLATTSESVPPALRSDDTTEIDVEQQRSIVINAGQFALINTLESVKLPADIAGHIGVRS